jgi:hypothetical protein
MMVDIAVSLAKQHTTKSTEYTAIQQLLKAIRNSVLDRNNMDIRVKTLLDIKAIPLIESIVSEAMATKNGSLENTKFLEIANRIARRKI